MIILLYFVETRYLINIDNFFHISQVTVVSTSGEAKIYELFECLSNELKALIKPKSKYEEIICFKEQLPVLIKSDVYEMRSTPVIKDFRYPNPTLLTTGLIMASTIVSEALLGKFKVCKVQLINFVKILNREIYK